jgi:hypothetical protein
VRHNLPPLLSNFTNDVPLLCVCDVSMTSEPGPTPVDMKLFVDDLLAMGAVRMEDYLRAPHAAFRSMETLPVDAPGAPSASSSKASGAPQGAQKRRVDAPLGSGGQPSGKKRKKNKGGN